MRIASTPASFAATGGRGYTHGVQGRWRIRLGEPSLAAALEPTLEVLARGERPPGAVPVKRTRAREVFRLELANGEAVYGKMDRIERDGFAGLRWRRPPARREYANLMALRTAGFPAVEPLALAECHGPRGRELWLFTRAVEGAHPLGKRLREGGTGIAAERLAEAAALARRLHEARFWHRDLHPGNLLVRDDGLHLVDLQKLRALPFPLPLRLRARDLVGLVGDGRPERRALPHEIADAYCGALPDGPDPKPFGVILDRAVARAERERLRSRGRRCVTPSTGFRCERRETERVYHRSDVPFQAALAAVAEAETSDDVRLDEFVGGPPAGAAPDPFGRGQGAPEEAAPARAPARMRRFGGGLGVRTPLRLAHPGLRAWRLAHALLLRGVDTPAPLALVEARRLGFVSHSWLLTRCVEDAPPLEVALAGAPDRAHRAGEALAGWHARGVEAAPLRLGYRVESGGLVASLPEQARLHDVLTGTRAAHDLAAVVDPLGPREREALVAGYREASER
jgi:hypothetical protein